MGPRPTGLGPEGPSTRQSHQVPPAGARIRGRFRQQIQVKNQKIKILQLNQIELDYSSKTYIFKQAIISDNVDFQVLYFLIKLKVRTSKDIAKNIKLP